MGKYENQTVLITGGSNGIGLATALSLSSLGYQVTIVGRDPEKCERVSSWIQTNTHNPVLWIAEDLSTLAGTKRVAEKFKEQNSKLNILINNAGAIFMKRYLTLDGLEKTFALNYLSPFLLSILLLDKLSIDPNSRIINVTSIAHRFIHRVDKRNIQGEKHYSGLGAYSQSKLFNLFFTYELSSKLLSRHIACNAVHPGFVRSSFAWNNGMLYKVFTYTGGSLFGRSPEKGAETIIFLAASTDAASVTGKYFFNLEALPSSSLSYDRTQSKFLWQLSIDMISNKGFEINQL